MTVGGNLTSMSVGGDMDGQVSVGGTLGAVAIGGSLGGPLTVTGALGNLTVGGSITGKITAASVGQIGVLSAQSAVSVNGVVLDIKENGVERLLAPTQ